MSSIATSRPLGFRKNPRCHRALRATAPDVQVHIVGAAVVFGVYLHHPVWVSRLEVHKQWAG